MPLYVYSCPECETELEELRLLRRPAPPGHLGIGASGVSGPDAPATGAALDGCLDELPAAEGAPPAWMREVPA
jgi:hypothetical protein